MTKAGQMKQPAPAGSSASTATPSASRPSAKIGRAVITSGPVRSTPLIPALPVLGEQMLNTFVTIFDTFLAGRLSTRATAAVGFASYVNWLVYMLVDLVGAGTTTLAPRADGGDDHDQANHNA